MIPCILLSCLMLAAPAGHGHGHVHHGVTRSGGNASWYGPGFAGRRTACGEVFNPAALTAASRSLPCGTRARVVNLGNGRSVVVRINDRGPYVGGRVIDLSRAAALAIGITGTGDVAITPIGR